MSASQSTKKRLHEAIEELPDTVTIEEALGRLYEAFRINPPSTLDQDCPGLEDMPTPRPASEAEQKRRLAKLLQPIEPADRALRLDRSFVSREAKKLLQRLNAGS